MWLCAAPKGGKKFKQIFTKKKMKDIDEQYS